MKKILTVVEFQTTRVRAPGKDNIKNYDACYNMWSADNLNFIKWWVDASHVAHDGMYSHTGATMYMGCGLVINMSKK